MCPWNRFSQTHNEPLFSPNKELLAMRDSDWEEMTEEVFNHLFEVSAIKRTKIEGLKRNIKFVKG